MKILIIGHTVEDHIVFHGEEQEIKPGGIFYSASGFHFLKDAEDEIYLCTSIQKDNYELFSFVYDEFKHDYFSYVEKIPKIHLNVFEKKERHERYENITDKLTVPFEALSKFDGIFINMITGFDINVKDLQRIRKNYKGPIYIDIHSLARGIDNNYRRDFRKIPEVDKWITSVDILQANEHEIFTLSEKKTEKEIAEELLSLGAKIILVTKGDRGASSYTLKNNELFSKTIPAIEVETKNKVGCGDVFGAAFFSSYIKDKNMEKAFTIANIAGGCIASYSEIKKMKDLKNDVLSRFS
ncbi:MAG: carbohydrate kinase family protein [Ignavibacteriaceae bacterium]|nr:carbohydrate kinase family protein [Ignavibacteriaceae bacterium]